MEGNICRVSRSKGPYVFVYVRKGVLTRRSLWALDCLNSSLAVREKNHFSSLCGCWHVLVVAGGPSQCYLDAAELGSVHRGLALRPRCLRSEITVSPSWMLTAAAPMWPSKPLPSVYIKEAVSFWVLLSLRIDSWVANAAFEGSMKHETRLTHVAVQMQPLIPISPHSPFSVVPSSTPMLPRVSALQRAVRSVS
jgi:hypothetical protein